MQNGVKCQQSDEELRDLYKQEHVAPFKQGRDLLNCARFNKTLSFSPQERHHYRIHGLYPAAVLPLEVQAKREIAQIREQTSDLAKYIWLDNLQARDEKLFYKVVVDHVDELLPIVYTPTVGTACQRFGEILRHPKGVYVTINDNSVSAIYQILSNWPDKEIKAIVVTDGERILGLGDLGAQGMGIPIGKLALYVALGGVQPQWCLPVTLDVGTDNEKLLNNPFYIGLKQKRERGDAYDTLVDNFMKACRKRYGQSVLIQFEDFHKNNAYRLLDKYREEYCTFNDDIQGTAAVTLAGLLSAGRVAKKKLSEMKILFYGAGGSATGTAELSVEEMKTQGLSYAEANEHIYLVNTGGLVVKSRTDLNPKLHRFAKDLPQEKDLLKVVKMVNPDAIIGLSTVKGAFTEEILKAMAEIQERPIIFALSNPTVNAECTAEDAYKHTKGKAIFASGSPFPDVHIDGKALKTGQCNNAYIFPGVGLGIVLFNVSHVEDKHFLIAARVLAESVPQKSLDEGLIYPKLDEIRELSVKIAVHIGVDSYKDGTALLYPKPKDLELYVRSQIYSTEYEPPIIGDCSSQSKNAKF